MAALSARRFVCSAISSMTFRILPIASERSPSRATTVFDSMTERRICSIASIVSRTAFIPDSAASATLRARSYECAAFVSTCAMDALISLIDVDVSVTKFVR
jgi:hypothetical protein